ncbi:hypothetical protein BHE74_00014826 [Ensete ventricosum]|nr:hypothetical protein GW17_00020550 [Ensete ventricosum]RWW77040.1 hypothetical protein BHE74_00014826 [Ensete ventricosum]RZR91399.1 hypothetical protein BHM03_00019511 [Ensete ventricosum]
MRWLSLSVDVYRKVISLNLYCRVILIIWLLFLFSFGCIPLGSRWTGLVSEERTVVMVCQAATRTRFRALKHENGIAGSTTIIVRVIACFRPLQDCQAEYFRHLLKPVT